MLRNIALICIILFTGLSQAHAEPLFGFQLNGETINPACLHKMRPWISDSGQIIVKSIVLEECQESNWASHGDLEIEEASVSTRIDDEIFSYTVIGKTDSGLFILTQTASYTGTDIVAYTINEQTIQPDLLKPETKKVHILTAVANSWILCFNRAWVKRDTVIVEKRVDVDGPRVDQCTDQVKRLEYKIRP